MRHFAASARFARCRQLLYAAAGRDLSPANKSLLVGRQGKRLKRLGLRDFGSVNRGELAGVTAKLRLTQATIFQPGARDARKI